MERIYKHFNINFPTYDIWCLLKYNGTTLEVTALAGPVFSANFFGEFYLAMWNLSSLLVSFHYSVMSEASLQVLHFQYVLSI